MSDYKGVTQTFVFIVKNRGSTFNEDPQIVQVEVMTRGAKWFVDEPIASPLNNEAGKLQVTGISPWTPLDSPGRLFAARDGSDVLDIYSACSSFQHFDVNGTCVDNEPGYMNIGAFENRLYTCGTEQISAAIKERLAVICEVQVTEINHMAALYLICGIVLVFTILLMIYLCLRMHFQTINQLRDISEAR